jgi:DNA-binding beta-propeller fold protein YncE
VSFNVRSRQAFWGLLSMVLLSVCQNAHASFSLTFQGLVQTVNTGGSISLSSPAGIVVDSAGDVYLVDTGNNQVVEVSAQGAASVLTINGLSPSLSSPSGIAIDGAGDLYIADTGNSRVVEVTPAGAGSVISTGSVALSSPRGVALDQSGDIFIADTGNNRIVEVTSGGSAAALTITVSSGTSTLSSPAGLAVNNSGMLYIADSGNNRVVTVAAGSTTGVVFSTGELDPALSNPSGVAVDRIGNVFIADTGHNRIVDVDTAGDGDVLLNSVFLQGTTLSGPLGVAVDVFGGVYVADTGDSRALVVDPSLGVDDSSSLNKTAVGFGHISVGSSTPTSFILSFSVGFPVDSLGNVNAFTAGTQNLDFQIVSGANTTCSGAPSVTYCTVEVSFLPTAPGLRSGALVLYDPESNPVLTVPLYGFGDAPLAALAPNTGSVIGTGGVTLSFPFQIALDGAGNIYDANDGGNLVKIPAGGGSASVVSPTDYTFGDEVTGVALDGAGNLFVSDHLNNRILVITPSGVTSVLNITGISLSLPTALAFDASGTLYIAGYGNGRTVEVSSIQVTGLTSTGIGTVIGTGSYTTSSEGNTGVAVDGMGNIYITDGYAGSDPSRVIKVSSAGVVSLLTPTGITFNHPEGVSADAMGNVYVADGGNNRIVKITAAGVASVLKVSGLPTPTTLGSPFGVTVDPFGNLYIPDSGNNRIVFVNVSGSALTYASTNQGQTSSDSPRIATVTNLGNEPLVFSTNPTYTANFSNNGNDTNPCTSSTSLSAGTACDVSINFTPQSAGSLSAGITVTDNTLNVGGSTQQVSVSGTGINAGDTTSTVVTISPASLTNGQTATITATVSDTTSGHTSTIPTGPVTFTDTAGSTVTTLNGGSTVNLTAGTATLPGVQLSGIGTHTITANYDGVSSTYLTSSSTAAVSLAKASVTITGPSAQPVAVTVGQMGSATITVTGPYTTIAAPSGTLSYNVLNSSNTIVASGTPALTAGSSGSTASIPISGTLASGSYTISITYSGDASYQAASTPTTIHVQIGQITPTISWKPSTTSITYGTTLSDALLNASAASGGTSVRGAFTYKATIAGGAPVTVTSASVLSAGSYILTATFIPTDTTTYATVTAQVPLTVTQLTPAVTLTSSASSVVLTNPLVFTATMSSTATTPTGTVSFLDGTAPLGQVTLSNGVAALSTSSLVAGNHTITAVYSGNANFSAAISGALTESVLDFSLSNDGGSGAASGSGTSASQTVTPGGTASYLLSILPTNGTVFPAPITLSLTGLPSGATASIAPSSWTPVTSTTWSFPANTHFPQQRWPSRLHPRLRGLSQELNSAARCLRLPWDFCCSRLPGCGAPSGKRWGGRPLPFYCWRPEHPQWPDLAAAAQATGSSLNSNRPTRSR